MLSSIDWKSFILGVIFALFVWPMLSSVFKGRTAARPA